MAPAALEALRGWLAESGATAAYITSPTSIAYLTGFRSDPHERLMALILRPGPAVLVVPALDEGKARAGAAGVEVRAWADGEDAYGLVREALGPAGGGLAVEKEHLTLAAAERLRALAAGGDWLDAGAAIRRMRARKSRAELGSLERAAAATDRVFERVAGGLAPGMTELEVATALDLAIAEEGASPSFDTLVQSGPNTALPHQGPGARRLRAGDLVLMDFGAMVEGYRADITRMAVVGEPDARQREIHGLVLAAHDAAVAAIRPGVRCGDVDEAARAVLRDAGVGDRFIHRVGHGLGLEPHEDPSLDPGGAAVLEEGMVATVEPGLYFDGWGGIRLEDDIAVEASGARLLTRAPHGLRSIG